MSRWMTPAECRASSALATSAAIRAVSDSSSGPSAAIRSASEPPSHQLEGHEAAIGVRTDVEHLDDMRVVDRRGGARLALEASQEVDVGDQRRA